MKSPKFLHLLTKTLLLALVLFTINNNRLQIAMAAPHGGVTISPAFQEVMVLKNVTSTDQKFVIQNNDDHAQTFTISVVDMGALDDTGGIVFSGLSVEYRQKYGLANWLRLERQIVTIAANSSETINFKVINDENLSPGGHYGALVINPETNLKAVNNTVELSPQAASLMFVRKTGGEVVGLSIKKISLGTSIWSLPTSLKVDLHNDGNIHLVPRGIIVIKDSFGHEVARGIINPESSILLPEHSRRFVVKITKSRKIILPGRYRVDISYRYDGITGFAHKSEAFTLINLSLLLLMAVIIYTIQRAYRTIKTRYGKTITKYAKPILKWLEKIPYFGAAVGKFTHWLKNIFLYLAKILKRLKVKPGNR